MSPFEQSFGPASLYLLCFRSNVGCLQRSSQIANALSKETNDPCKAQCCFSKAMSTYSKCRDLLDIYSERRRMRKKQKKDGLNQIFWLLFDLFLRNLANLAVFSICWVPTSQLVFWFCYLSASFADVESSRCICAKLWSHIHQQRWKMSASDPVEMSQHVAACRSMSQYVAAQTE